MSCEITARVLDFDKFLENMQKHIKDKDIKRQDNLKVDHVSIVTDTENKGILKSIFSKKVVDRAVASKELSKLTQNVKVKISRFINHKSANNLYKLFNADELSSQELTGLSVGATIVMDALDTESDLYEKYNLSASTIANLSPEGNLTTDLKRLYPVIGRAVLEAQGKILAGDAITTLQNYVTVGKETVAALEKQGIIQTAKNMDAIKGDSMRKADGEYIDSTNTSGIAENDKYKLYKTDVVMLNKEHPSYKDKASIQTSLKQMMRLVLPYTEKLPLNKDGEIRMDMRLSPDVRISGTDAKKLKDNIKEVVNKVQQSEFKVSNSAVGFIRELAKIWEDNKDNVNINKLMASKLSNDSLFLKDVLGLDNLKTDELDIYFDSLSGQELSKVSPLISLLQNSKELTDEEVSIQFNMFIARNSRTHVYNDTLNYQTDKFMSRQILEAKEDTVYDTEEDVIDFVQRLAESSGFTIDDIMTPGNNVELEKALDFLNRTDETQVDIISALYEVLPKTGFQGKFWEGVKALKAINDVRNAEMNEDGTIKSIKSAHLFEVDATASGILIKLLYSMDSDSNTDINKLLTNMISEKIDSYQMGVEALENLIAEGEKDNPIPRKKRFAEKAKDLLERIKDGSGKELRTLLKDAIMTYSYGQEAKNNATEFAKNVVDKLLPKAEMITDVINLNLYTEEGVKETKNFQEYLSKLEAKYGKLENKTIKSLSPAEQKAFRHALIEAVAANVGTMLVEDVLTKTYGETYFQTYDGQVKELYDVLVETTKGKVQNIKVKSPVSLVFGKDLDAEVELKLTKLRETLVNLPNSDETSIVKLEHENPISAKVVPIHATDSAVLLQTLKDMYAELGKEFNPKTDSVQMIHDAIQANGKIAKRFSELYEQNLIKIAYEYDVRTELIKAIEAAGGTIDLELKERVEKAVSSKEAGIKEAFKLNDANIPSNTLKHSFTTDLSKFGKTIYTKDATSSDLRTAFPKPTETTVDNKWDVPFEAQVELIEKMKLDEDCN